jgi:hypothetical protein
MTVLWDIRVQGTFREPQFADLGLEHVRFDEDPAVLGSVALGAALEAARTDDVDLEGHQSTPAALSRSTVCTASTGCSASSPITA